jgi:hypothetical protein
VQDAFVSLTGEKEPTSVTQKETVSEPWRAVDILTLGVGRLWASSHEEDVTKVSPDYDAERDAPKSSALYSALNHHFGPVELVAARRGQGEGKARLTSELDLFFDNPNANDCYASVTVMLQTPAWNVESETFPDASSFAPFPIDSWEGSAKVSGHWRTALGSHDGDLEVTSTH